MPRYLSSKYLADIEAKHLLIQAMFRLSRGTPISYEIEKLLASYYVVEVCSGLENAAKSTVKDMVMKSTAPDGLKHHLLNSKYLPSARHGDICEFIGLLDSKVKNDYKNRVKTIEIDASESLYTNRQRVVHYGDSRGLSITIRDVEDWQMKASWLIRKMETSLKQAL